jgi:hypothetical protein
VTRVSVIVEGPTERSFVQQVLAPLLWASEIYLGATILGVPGHKGGRTNYVRVKKDVLRQLKEDRTACCSTMLDFYGLGMGFPGTPVPPNLLNVDKVIHLERAMKEDIVAEVPDLRPDVRFLPYLQLHEYEGLLFSDPEAFANGISQSGLASQFQAIRQSFPTPEDIDDNPDTAPSKRVLRLWPPYNKVVDGTRAASAVGIAAMQRECPHFRDWVERLGRLGSPSF